MADTCNFCRRIFQNKQGVRAHLKHCQKYKENGQESASYSDTNNSFSKNEFPSREIQRQVQNKKGQQDIVAKQGSVSEDEFTRLREEKERMAKKRREIIQNLKVNVVDWRYLFSSIPTEARARAKVEIEEVLGRLPVLELPHHELTQIAEGIRDKIFAPYLKTAEDGRKETTQDRKEVKEMTKQRVYSGFFVCSNCNAEYELDYAAADDLRCDECGQVLEEAEEEEEE